MLRRSSTREEHLRRLEPSFGKEDSLPHARQDRQASSVSRPLEGRQRPKKPGPSLLQVASPVGRGTPVILRLPVLSKVVNWPLVQIPTDRHTTTGTCVLGKCLFGRIVRYCKRFLSVSRIFPHCRKTVRIVRARSGALCRMHDARRSRTPSDFVFERYCRSRPLDQL